MNIFSNPVSPQIPPRAANPPAQPPMGASRAQGRLARIAGHLAPGAEAQVQQPRDAQSRAEGRLARIWGHVAPVAGSQELAAGDGPQAALAPGVTPPGKGAQVIAVNFCHSRPGTEWKWNDVHAHQTNYAQQGNTFLATLARMDRLGIQYSGWSPIPTNQLVYDGDKGYRLAHGIDTCGCNYYIHIDSLRAGIDLTLEEYHRIIAETPPLSYDTECDMFTATGFLKLTPAQRERFDPAVTGLELGDVRCAGRLLSKVATHPGVYTMVGEVTIHKEIVQDKLDPRVQADLRPGRENIAGISHLIQTSGDIGMPMLIHCDADVIPQMRKPGAEPEYFPHCVALFKRPECRNTTIIWAHAGGIGKYSHMRPDHLERLEEMLNDPECAHVHLDISWDVVAHQLTLTGGKKGGAFDQAKADKWVAFMEKYSDRILFGSDCLAPPDDATWNATYVAYQKCFEKLSPQARHRILQGNYERLIVAARPRVRAFERHCVELTREVVYTRNDIAAFPAIQMEASRKLRFKHVEMERELAASGHGDPKRQHKAEIALADAVLPAQLEGKHKVLALVVQNELARAGGDQNDPGVVGAKKALASAVLRDFQEEEAVEEAEREPLTELPVPMQGRQKVLAIALQHELARAGGNQDDAGVVRAKNALADAVMKDFQLGQAQAAYPASAGPRRAARAA